MFTLFLDPFQHMKFKYLNIYLFLFKTVFYILTIINILFLISTYLITVELKNKTIISKLKFMKPKPKKI